MRNSALVFMTISAILLSSCGRMDVTARAPQASDEVEMSENDALETLNGVPLEPGRMARNGKMSAVSAQELEQLLQDLVASGQLGASGFRGAAAGTVDLSQLNNIFTLLQSGQANNIFSLAKGLVSMNAGSTTGTASKLDGILSLLNAALPIITAIAPQFAGIITALTTILPLVMTFIGMFRKKAAIMNLFFPTVA